MVVTTKADREAAVEWIDRADEALWTNKKKEPDADFRKAHEYLGAARRALRYDRWDACVSSCKQVLCEVEQAVSAAVGAQFDGSRAEVLADIRRAREVYSSPELDQLASELQRQTDWFRGLGLAEVCKYSEDALAELSDLRGRVKDYVGRSDIPRTLTRLFREACERVQSAIKEARKICPGPELDQLEVDLHSLVPRFLELFPDQVRSRFNADMAELTHLQEEVKRCVDQSQRAATLRSQFEETCGQVQAVIDQARGRYPGAEIGQLGNRLQDLATRFGELAPEEVLKQFSGISAELDRLREGVAEYMKRKEGYRCPRKSPNKKIKQSGQPRCKKKR